MEISLELWASVMNAGIFLCLIAIPWVMGVARLLVIILGFGGILCLLGFDLYVGIHKNDYALAADFMLLTITKVIFFVGVSWCAEKLFRVLFRRAKVQKQQKEWEEAETSRSFNRNLRGLKEPEVKPRKR